MGLVERVLMLGRAYAGVDFVLEYECEVLANECGLLGGEFLWLGHLEKDLAAKNKNRDWS